MATTTWAQPTFSSFANVSQTGTPGSCGPCTSAQLLDLWRGSWTQNSSLPALRTIQPIVDPAYNTTSTSTICNTAALTAYDQCEGMTLNDDCDIVCVDMNGRPATEAPYTITLAGASGNFIQFASSFRVQGGVSTTDDNGASTCLTSLVTLPAETSYTYAGPTSVTETGMGLLIMYDLTDYYPGEALFEQCTLFQTGPPPVALTAANQIILPVQTLPGAGTTTQPTTSPSTTPATTARPADSGAGTSPSRTSGNQATVTSIPSLPEETNEPPTETPEEPDNEPTATAPGNSNSPPTETETPGEQDEKPAASTTQRPVNPPVQSDDSEEQDHSPEVPSTIVVPTLPTNNVPSTAAQTQNPGPNTSAGSQPANGAPIIPATTPAPAITTTPIAIVPGVTFQNDDGSPEIVVGGSTTIVAGNSAAVGSGTTFSVLPSSGGIIAAADGSTTTLPLPVATVGAEQSFVRPLTTSAQGFALPGAIIAGGGEAVTDSGTTFSALPSNLGVVAVSEGGFTTVQGSQLAPLGISTVAGSPGAYVLPAQTLAFGGSAVVVSGATYSVLPESSGIEVAANGQTSVIDITEATSLPGIGEIGVINSVADGYVIDGSVTVIAGGPASTVSDVVFSALPSGLGVLVADGTGSDEFASYIEQGISGSESDSDSSGDAPYVIGGTALLSAGSDAVTVSGVVYSALPSGSGILVVADGESTTIGLGSATDISHGGGGPHATATSGSSATGTDDSPALYTGAASSKNVFLTGCSGCVISALMAMIVML